MMKRIHKKVASATKKVVHKIKKIIKGFTIIELIVVIAIIAILATIVTVAVSGQVNKAKDSRLKTEVSEIIKSASMYYASHNTFSGYSVPASFVSVCSDSSYTLSTSESDAFVVYAKLCSSDNYWCADSTGAVKQIENPPDSGVYTCISGSGDGAPSGCGSNPACSQGQICYNNSDCVQCNSDGLCSYGEDCRCGDCVCTTENSCIETTEGSYGCIDSVIVAQFVLLRAGFENKYNSQEPHTYYGYCASSYSWPPYNYSDLNEIYASITNHSYNFMCAESDVYPQGINCYNHDEPEGWIASRKWYAIACNMGGTCYCTDSTNTIVEGSYDSFTNAGSHNCSCFYQM